MINEQETRLNLQEHDYDDDEKLHEGAVDKFKIQYILTISCMN